MAMSDINKARKDAVREAWRNEKASVMKGSGTRDWSQRQQISLVRKGQVNGFHGHHMQSVKTHQHQAGNPHNIQFLTKSEHIQGAHGGKTTNSTNGFYNPQTGTMHGFGNNNPQAPQMKLSNPLSQTQISSAIKREQAFQNRVSQDRAFANQWRQANGYSPMFGSKTQSRTSQSSGNKGIDSVRSQSAKAQVSSTSTQQSSQNKGLIAAQQKASATQTSSSQANKGISSYQSRANGQPSGARGSSSGATKGASSGQASGSSSGQGR